MPIVQSLLVLKGLVIIMEISQNTILLSTKLKIPAPRKNYVVRKALFEKLSDCEDMSVIFVRGGAGTGKTTLLSSFIRETGLKNVCWVSIDATNANVYSFWLYFTAAITSFWEDGDSILALMRSNPDASHMENLLIMLINRICGEEDYYMVLDDVHCMKDAALVKTFEFFISAMPSNLHLIMLSREDPPVYLGPLAVSGRLTFVDGKQMQLSTEEGILFLKDTLKLNAKEEDIIHLNTYAEGWIGGLQLAAAAGAIGKFSGELLKAGGGIATEYLTREVLEALNPKQRDFLLRTGFISYFDGDLCTLLFEEFTKTEFNQMMEELIQKNLFVICMDEQNGIYRYHNILSEYLTHQFLFLSEEEKKNIYIKTAQAFEQRGDYEEALREYCASGEYSEVLRIARAMEGRIEAWSFLDQVPMELLIEDSDLTAQCFMYNLGNLNVERCRTIFTAFQVNYGDSDIFKIVQFAEVYFNKSDGTLPQFNALSADQIDKLNLSSVTKAMILVENSTVLVEQMQYEEAENCIKKAIRLSAGTNVFVDFYAYNQLAQIYEEIGCLNESLNSYTKSEAMLNSPSMLTANGTNYYFGLAGVYMRRMELDKAAKALERAKSIIEEQHIHVDITDMTLIYHLAEMQFLHGKNEEGVCSVRAIISKYPSFSVLTLGRLIHELECANRLTPYLRDEYISELERANNYRYQPFMRLLRARLLFKRGDVEEAFKETEEILTFSRLHNNKIRLVEADLLKILMILNSPEKSTDQREINNLLCEAVHYAHENRIFMPFFLDRSTFLPLLINLSVQSERKKLLTKAQEAFVREAMELCGYLTPVMNSQELLSARELDVLKEMALGITNREIAQKLCISQATVKTHLISIFGKLGVSSRMMAVEKGKQEGLIQ